MEYFVAQTPWWRHQMETFSALLAIRAGNSPVPGEFPAQRPVTRSFDVFFDLRLNKQLSKQWWGWWFETPSCPLWRHRNVLSNFHDFHTSIRKCQMICNDNFAVPVLNSNLLLSPSNVYTIHNNYCYIYCPGEFFFGLNSSRWNRTETLRITAHLCLKYVNAFWKSIAHQALQQLFY